MSKKQLAAQNERIKELVRDRSGLRFAVSLAMQCLRRGDVAGATAHLERADKRTALSMREMCENIADGLTGEAP